MFQKTLLTATNKYALAGAFKEYPPPPHIQKAEKRRRHNMGSELDPKDDVAPAGYDKMITDLEDQTWKALQKSGSELLQFLSPDCVMLFPLGLQVSHKSEPNIEDILTSPAFIPWDKYQLMNISVIPLGASAATITYMAKATRPDTIEFKALISSTWRKVPDGTWEMCVHQQTPWDQGIDELAD